MFCNPFKPIAQTLVKSLPKGLATTLTCIPTHLSHAAIETSLNFLFSEELKYGEIDFLNGKSLLIEMSDLNFSFNLSLKNGRIVIIDTTQADTNFKARFEQYVLLAGQFVDPDTLFFNRQLTIMGDTELGLEVKGIIENFDRSRFPKPINQLIATHCQLIRLTPRNATP